MCRCRLTCNKHTPICCVNAPLDTVPWRKISLFHLNYDKTRMRNSPSQNKMEASPVQLTVILNTLHPLLAMKLLSHLASLSGGKTVYSEMVSCSHLKNQYHPLNILMKIIFNPDCWLWAVFIILPDTFFFFNKVHFLKHTIGQDYK